MEEFFFQGKFGENSSKPVELTLQVVVLSAPEGNFAAPNLSSERISPDFSRGFSLQSLIGNDGF